MKRNNWKIFLLGFLFSLSCPLFALATEINFNIDPSFDYSGRDKISATFLQGSNNAYFYIEDVYYQSLTSEQKKTLYDNLTALSQEFDNVIYPKLTEAFGSEWKPGIDKDNKLTVLLTQIKPDSAGYFNQSDEYPKAQVPSSNEREMIYFNVKYLDSPLAKSYLAHELVHLITFNQKDKINNAAEDTWLSEARAEIAPTILGYDANFESSNLQRRVKTFAQQPSDSLVEWQNNNIDYASVNLFSQYILDQYGLKIFSDSMKSPKIGVVSLNEALKKNGFSDDLSQVFANWTLALYVNDCRLGLRYCYLNANLKTIKVVPQLNVLPFLGESILSSSNYTKNWAGNWLKIIGGKGTLKLEFTGDQNLKFKAPYLVEDIKGNLTIKFLELSTSQYGLVLLPDFGSKYNSLIIIPSLSSKTANFLEQEPYYQYILTISVVASNSSTSEESKYLAQIATLQQEIARLQLQIATLLAQQGSNTGSNISCQKIDSNLYYGMKNSSQVRCLQQFLKAQGVYPAGTISGNFLSLTKAAVIKFQEKYAADILAPLGYTKGTGNVGSSTRNKINQLLSLGG